MKKAVNIIVLGIILAFSSCKKQDSLYEEYLVPNGRVYPAKALNAEAHSGRERVEIVWQNGTDPKVVKARISWNNYTEWEEIDVTSDMDTIRKEIKPLKENTYSFVIRTYDAKGNISVPVEILGNVYGDFYESALVNRTVKSVSYDNSANSIEIEWFGGSPSEAGMELEYTDADGHIRTMTVENMETTATVPDVKSGAPLYYATMFKPDSAAIDVFYAPKTMIPYWADITAHVLKNTVAPFATQGEQIVENRWFRAADWTANAAAAANGNVDTNVSFLNGVLTLWGWSGLSPVTSIVNGKLYQTVELEAGEYRFDAFLFGNTQTGGNPRAYVVAASGNDLPDTNNVGHVALASTAVPPPPIATNSNLQLSVDFVLSEKSNVSLGFVITCGAPTQVSFRKVELWKLVK